MATFRSIHLTFWTDSKVDDDFTPEDKYFYLYLQLLFIIFQKELQQVLVSEATILPMPSQLPSVLLFRTFRKGLSLYLLLLWPAFPKREYS